MFEYEVTLKLYTYDWDQTPSKRIDVKKTFKCDSWDMAKDLIGLMVDSTGSLSIDIDKKEVKIDE